MEELISAEKVPKISIPIPPVWNIERDFVQNITDDPRLLYADTDSFVGNTNIIIDGNMTTVSDLYDNTNGPVEIRSENNFIKHIKHLNKKTLSVSNDITLESKNVNYIMKHKVKKRFFKVIIYEKEVIITEDHSLIVKRNGKLIDISPKEILPNDRLFKIQRKTKM